MSDGTWERYAEDQVLVFRHDPAAGGEHWIRVRPARADSIPSDDAPVVVIPWRLEGEPGLAVEEAMGIRRTHSRESAETYDRAGSRDVLLENEG